MIKVSVLMPAYNARETIRSSVESILDQTYENFELIIADDCSNDGTLDALNDINDSRIKIIRNDKNIGSLLTRNILASHAKGELIAWQDSDDFSHPERLKRQVDFLGEHDDIALCGTNFIRLYPFWKRFIKSDYPLTDSEIRYHIQQTNSIPFCAPSTMIRASAFHEVGGMRDYFRDYGWYDFDLILRVMKNHKVGNINGHFYEYRYIPKSSSRKVLDQKKEKLFINEIGLFINNNSFDLIDDEKIKEFMENISIINRYDSSYEYYIAAKNLRSNLCHANALSMAKMAIQKSPILFRNYLLLQSVALSLFKSILMYPMNYFRYNRLDTLKRGDKEI